MMKKERKLRPNIYVFGNPLVAGDSLSLRVAKRLKNTCNQVEFVLVDPNEEILEKDFVIMDVAKGIQRVCMIDDLEQLQAPKSISLHDFDAAFSLKLMQKVGKIERIRILAIPMHYTLSKACKEVDAYVQRMFKK